MTLRFVVLEDMGIRTRALSTICKDIGSVSGERFADLAPEDMLVIAPDIAEFGPEDLATVDAVFVDFDLQTSKAAGHMSWEPFTLSTGLKVPPVTGMSAFLYVRDLMESSEYQRARRSHVEALRAEQREWLGQSGKTRLFTFVEAKDAVSMLFAASAVSWFEASYFNAQPELNSADNRDTAARQLSATPEKRLQVDRPARRYHRRVAPALDQMLIEEDFRGKGQQLILGDVWPTNYDLFRIYLEHRGKSGFGSYQDPSGFRDAVFEVCGLALAPNKVPKESTDRVFARMQASLEKFHTVTDLNAKEWPDWDGLARGKDPMLDYLTESQLFWTAPDVRIAFQEHLRRREETR